MKRKRKKIKEGDWKAAELKDKKRKEYFEGRISSDHNMLGELEVCHTRDKDIPHKKTVGKDGMIHVEPTRIQVGAKGFTISADDWTRIFGTEEEKAMLESDN